MINILIFNRLKQHSVNDDILVAEQYGFRDGVSTQTAVFNLTNHILRAWNDKKSL
jgi:hypothetical protein